MASVSYNTYNKGNFLYAKRFGNMKNKVSMGHQ